MSFSRDRYDSVVSYELPQILHEYWGYLYRSLNPLCICTLIPVHPVISRYLSVSSLVLRVIPVNCWLPSRSAFLTFRLLCHLLIVSHSFRVVGHIHNLCYHSFPYALSLLHSVVLAYSLVAFL